MKSREYIEETFIRYGIYEKRPYFKKEVTRFLNARDAYLKDRCIENSVELKESFQDCHCSLKGQKSSRVISEQQLYEFTEMLREDL